MLSKEQLISENNHLWDKAMTRLAKCKGSVSGVLSNEEQDCICFINELNEERNRLCY